MVLSILFSVGLASFLPTQAPTPDPKELIGEVLGKPVSRGDLKGRSTQELFLAPVWERYKKEHKAEIEPSEEEIVFAVEVFARNKDLKMKPGRDFALFMLTNWKLQKHLYDNFGGGRILWQQAGQEAFDATHQWLLAQEKKGAFEISDPKLREAVYEYWTTKNHGPFLTADKERIRREFLEPEWVKPPAKK